MSIPTLAEVHELAAVMNIKYAAFRGERVFTMKIVELEGRAVHLEVILKNDDSSFYYPVSGLWEAPHEVVAEAKREASLALVDVIDSYFEEFFESGEEVLLPIDWSPLEAGGLSIHIKGQIQNLRLEEEATKWLEKDDLECFGPSV